MSEEQTPVSETMQTESAPPPVEVTPTSQEPAPIGLIGDPPAAGSTEQQMMPSNEAASVETREASIMQLLADDEAIVRVAPMESYPVDSDIWGPVNAAFCELCKRNGLPKGHQDVLFDRKTGSFVILKRPLE